MHHYNMDNIIVSLTKIYVEKKAAVELETLARVL